MGLTKDQEKALSEAKKGSNIFITGSGGVGKSYVTQHIITALKDIGKNVLVTASTGKAAMLIDGVTCHSAFHIPIKMTWLAEPNVKKNDAICTADTILIDEVSMLRIDTFDYVVKVIEAANRIRQSFGKNPIQIIVVGDFCQLPPVIVRSIDGTLDEKKLMNEHYGFDIGGGYAFRAPGWDRCSFVRIELTEVIRQTDRLMVEALNQIRFGDKSAIVFFANNSRKKEFAEDEKAVVLCGRNKTAERLNNQAVSRLPGNRRVYNAIIEDQVTEQDKQAPDKLELKIGAQVIMLQNTDKYKNGSTGTIKGLQRDKISVEIHESGDIVEVPYTTWDVERYVVVEGKDGEKKIEKEKIGSFSQLPIRLGYAITIHKSQGQTYDRVELRPEIFAPGQLYVALSRVRSMDGLYIGGKINDITILADQEVVEFYSKNTTVSAVKREDTKDTDEVITCPERILSIVKIFVQSLSPEASIEGTIIHVPEKYRERTVRFINAF